MLNVNRPLKNIDKYANNLLKGSFWWSCKYKQPIAILLNKYECWIS